MVHKKQQKRRRNRLLAVAALVAVVLSAVGWKVAHSNVAVLNAAGPIAAGERRLLVVACLLMLIVVIPVFGLTLWIVLRYRETNHKATYQPEWDHSRAIEAIWWLVPSALIAMLAVITWFSAHQYDPYRPIDSKKTALNVQVVALNWRWLFMYPDLHVASLNELDMPVNTPVNFSVTADAPMNSFWIPQLGGQIYAMPGMSTKLSLLADKTGSYYGESANISGQGFAGMNFEAKALPAAQFAQWVKAAQSRPELDQPLYDQMSRSSTDKTVSYYSMPASGLYNAVINKYMSMPGMSDMQMGGM